MKWLMVLGLLVTTLLGMVPSADAAPLPPRVTPEQRSCMDTPSQCHLEVGVPDWTTPAYGCDWNYGTQLSGCVSDGQGDYDCDALYAMDLARIHVMGDDWMALDEDEDGIGCENIPHISTDSTTAELIATWPDGRVMREGEDWAAQIELMKRTHPVGPFDYSDPFGFCYTEPSDRQDQCLDDVEADIAYQQDVEDQAIRDHEAEAADRSRDDDREEDRDYCEENICR
jgi:hypothetical protein